MKALIIIVSILVLSACASNKKASCDAYSKVEKTSNPS